MKIYLAGPIFTEAEQLWTDQLKEEIYKKLKLKNISVEIIWPYQEINTILSNNQSDDVEKTILKVCLDGLSQADTLVAVLDGTQVDDGTAWEIGYFYNRKKRKIIGLRTDMRNAGDTKESIINSLIFKSIDKIVTNKQKLIEELIKLSLTNLSK